MWRRAVVLASMLAVGCSARLAAVADRDAGTDASEREGGADAAAEALNPMPCPAQANLECSSPQFVRVSWYAADGGLDRCECIPPGEVQCTPHYQFIPDATPPQTPLGPSLCQCNVCGPMRVQTRVCGYDPYYGYLSFAECVE